MASFFIAYYLTIWSLADCYELVLPWARAAPVKVIEAMPEAERIRVMDIVLPPIGTLVNTGSYMEINTLCTETIPFF